MLTLRLQRTGRKKLAHYRLIAQEHSRSPKSGRVVEFLGSFNPYKKELIFEKEKVEKHLSNGAQPSNKVAKLLKDNGVKLPSWVTITQRKERKKEEPKETDSPAPEPAATTEEVAEPESSSAQEVKTGADVAETEPEAESVADESTPAEDDKSETEPEATDVDADETKQ